MENNQALNQMKQEWQTLQIALKKQVKVNVTLAVLFGLAAINMLRLSFILQTPHNGNINTLKYSQALIRFKKRYIWSEIVGSVVVIPILIWAILSMDSNVPGLAILIISISGVVGVIVGVSLSLKVLRNIKELQEDIMTLLILADS